MTAGDLATCWILGGHRRHRPPLQFGIKTSSFLAQSHWQRMGSSFSIAWVNAGHELEVPERRSESDRHILLSKKRWRGQLPASQHQPPSGSAGYFRGLCIDANDLAFLHEQRDLHFKTCLQFCNFLCAAGSSVAAHARLGRSNGEFHILWKLKRNGIPVVFEKLEHG